jgi:PIN domain nuclease of toxin-antitoxin system
LELIGWILLSVVVTGLYVLAMTIYRLSLDARKLLAEANKLSELLASLQNAAEVEIIPATPSSAADYVQLVTKRAALKRKRLLVAQARERRLIERIGSIDVDKRKS